MTDFALLVLRLVAGSLVAAHGAQKLFGWFNGPGREGTAGFMESLGVRPGRIWGTVAGLGEFTGGVLTALGFLSPLGPLNIMGAMGVAIRKAHWKLPLFASQGGAELPMTNFAVALVLAIIGPGRYSLDRLIGFRMPGILRAAAMLFTALATYAALRRPELAEKVVNTAATVVGGSSIQPTSEPGMMRETRPQPQSQPEGVR